MNLLQTVGSFLVALTILVFVHELGHYLAARWCGVKVLRFSIGFGPSLLRWHVGRDRTEWTLAAIPLGGYVKMLDERENPDTPPAPEELHRAFGRQPLSRRALIVAAGPIANFLLAIVLYATLNLSGVQEPVARLDIPATGTAAAAAGIRGGELIVGVDGAPARSWNEFRLGLIDASIERRPLVIELDDAGARRSVTLDVSMPRSGEVDREFVRSLGLELAPGRITVASIIDGGAAAAAGLRTGDAIVSVDGQAPGRVAALVEAIRARPGQTMRLGVQRGADTLDISVLPEAIASDRTADAGRNVGRIGAGLSERLDTLEVRHGPVDATVQAVRQTWDMSAFSLRMLGKMIAGELSWRNLSGPVTIADHAGQSARVGWQAYLAFMALISVSLGVLNLLPVPVLDGGHLVYYGLEAATGRPLPQRFLEFTQKAGLAIVAAMMLLALFNDITRLIGS